MTLLMYMVADGGRRGYSLLLGEFWDEARAFGLSLPTAEPVTAPSFCSARYKITPELLRHLLFEVVGLSLEDSFSDRRWNGRRVFAVDGSKIPLQRSEELEFAFGVPDPGYCPQILLSVLLDVCAKMPVDLEIGPYGSCERGHLLGMLASLTKGDILVLDRGYPSHEVLQALVAADVDFLIRVPASHSFSAIDELRQSGRDDGTFWFEPPEKGSPADWRPLELRVVRIAGPEGSESFFVTTLKRSEFSRTQLRELYHMRWEAEEFYKLLAIGSVPLIVERSVHELREDVGACQTPLELA